MAPTLIDSILALEGQLLDTGFERTTLYLDLFQIKVVTVGHQAGKSGLPIQAYEKAWIKISELPERVVPSSVVYELLRIEGALEALCDAHQGVEWVWERKLEEFRANVQSLEFWVFWDPEDWYNLKEVYDLFEGGMSPAEVADYYGYQYGADLLNKEEAISYLLEKRRLWEEEQQEEE